MAVSGRRLGYILPTGSQPQSNGFEVVLGLESRVVSLEDAKWLSVMKTAATKLKQEH